VAFLALGRYEPWLAARILDVRTGARKRGNQLTQKKKIWAVRLMGYRRVAPKFDVHS